MESIWEETASIKSFNPLSEDKDTDVLIIGGGLAGILCAYTLQAAGVDYILVESEKICSGITKNTTAKITSHHGFIYDKLIREFDVETAKGYLRANEEAISEYARLCENLDCNFERKDNFVYSINNFSKVRKENDALHILGAPSMITDSTPLPFPIAGTVKMPNQAQFNPLKFVSSICGGLNIYEHTKVRELIGTTAVVDHGRITAKRIVVATHFPFLNKHGSYFIKMYQDRSYVIALKDAPQLNGMYVDEAQKGLSFRNYDGLLLIGGGSHRTGKSGGCYGEIRDVARKHYPDATEVAHWATQDCMTLDSVPYIGRYSDSTENLYVATGFNKWGMTTSMVAAKLLTDMLTGSASPYENVFSPSRTILRPKLAANAGEAILGLITPTTKRCPHLGCALKWNEEEHTWDCSCHGSRFTKDGELIDNPAEGNLKK